MNLKSLVKTAAKALSKKSPAIFTGLGIVGFGTTVYMVAKASPEAKRIHDHEVATRESIKSLSKPESAKHDELQESYLYEAKRMVPLYGPPAIVGVASVGCFLMANKINVNRREAIAAAYSLSTETLSRYQDKVIEKLGEEAHADILDETLKEVADNHPEEGYSFEESVIPAGQVRVYDNVTGRYFYCSKERIMEAESEVNKRLPNEIRVTLQEFYYAMGLEERFNFGETHGWDVTDSYGRNNVLDIFFGPHLDDEKNPCLAINYHVMSFERDI